MNELSCFLHSSPSKMAGGLEQMRVILSNICFALELNEMRVTLTQCG